MKSSPLDTFCRALVLGGLLGALGWGAIRYTNLPQLALAQLNTWNKAAINAHSVTPPQPESATASASSIPSVTLPQIAMATTGASQSTNQPHLHPTQQAAYLEAAPIRKKWNEHLSGKLNWQDHLWGILMFQAWLDI